MRKKFLWRSFISFGLVFTSFFVIVSGIVLYLAPAGRIAHWMSWRMFGLLKDDWQAFHTIFSCAFVILSIIHLFFLNWKAFWSYLKSKSKKGINRKRELFFSVIMISILFLGTFFKIPPFSSIMDFSETLAESWEEKEKAPPIPHAEKLNIIQLAELMKDLTEIQVLNRLRSNDIKVDNMEQTLTEIGKKNDKSPSELYEIIIKYNKSNTDSGIGR